MGETEQNKLYKDAIYWHLIGKGYSEFLAEIEARRLSKEEKEI